MTAAEDVGRSLNVFCADQAVGRLDFDTAADRIDFQYRPQWLAHKNRFQLSPHLPFKGEISSVAVRRFIDNLLPEGRALDIVSSFTNIQKTNLFGLIRVLGRETSGALSFLPAGEQPQQAPEQRRAVSTAELQQRIDDRNRVPFTVWDGKVRMSVAGYQDKLLVLKENNELFLVDGALSSTHILKPEPLNDRLPYMVANEHFCMRFANRLGQRRMGQDWAAKVEILRMPSPVLCITRFDRQRLGDRVQRLHVIDGCQALNLPVAADYIVDRADRLLAQVEEISRYKRDLF